MKTRLFLVVSMALILAVGASAQGRGMRMMGGGGAAFLLQREDVRKDLGVTADQQSKLEAIQSDMREEMRAKMQDLQGDREAMMAEFRKMQEAMTKKINEVLTVDQQKRLKEINIQINGNRSVLQPDIAKEIGLTDDQNAKIKDLQAKQNEANQAVFEKVRNGEIDREQVQEIMDKNNKSLDEEIGKVLTQAQKDKLKDMSGKPFKADGNGG
ncbi:MAG: hypothetical protein JSS66_14200 [Armatimonadetes bacterium]|nr:hypothetical protein [Armatimonadota bacterium]